MIHHASHLSCCIAGYKDSAECQQTATELAWDAGRPLGGQTEVLVAPGTKGALLQQQQQQHEDGNPKQQSTDHESEVSNKAGVSLQLSLDSGDVARTPSPGLQLATDQDTAAVTSPPSQVPQAGAAAFAKSGADSAEKSPNALMEEADDADSYQGLPTSQADLSPYQKQSGYSFSDDEVQPALSLHESEAGFDQADAADGQQDGAEQQEKSNGAAELPNMGDREQDAEQQQQQASAAAAGSADAEVVQQRNSVGGVDSTALLRQEVTRLLDLAVVSADSDMEIDIEAAEDWSAGSTMEVQHTEGSLWSWQSAKLCDTVTPQTDSITVTYATASGCTCRDVSVQQIRPVPPFTAQITSTLMVQRGDVVEVDLGDHKYLCAIVVSKPWHLQMPKLDLVALKAEECKTHVDEIAAALRQAHALDILGVCTQAMAHALTHSHT